MIEASLAYISAVSSGSTASTISGCSATGSLAQVVGSKEVRTKRNKIMEVVVAVAANLSTTVHRM